MQSSVWIKVPVILFVIFSLLFHSSCTHEPVDFSQLDTVCFNSQIMPLIQNSCGITGCHDGVSAEEGFNATSYETILQVVTPGNPKGSKLYHVITDIWSENFMPPDYPLSIVDRNLIQVWIAQGALKTVCDIDTTKGNPSPDPDTICFVQDILPVFISSCATSSCHDAITHSDGYNLSDYISIMSNQEGIVPYSPGSSKIYEVVTENESDDRMPPPPRAALTTGQIEKLRTWILDGAPYSDCPQNICDTLSDISFNNQVFPIIENNCLSCHNSTTANGGVLLNSYQNVKATAETERNGTSLLVGAIRYLNGFSAMPPGNQLNKCSVRTIELWIEQGFQDN